MGPTRAALIVMAALLCSCASSAAPSATPSSASACGTGAPEGDVYQPDRLQVLDPCKHAVGFVVDIAAEDDGDYHVWFKPDSGYEYLMNPENHFQAKPAMLGEITPDCTGQPPDAEAAAKCPKSKLPLPKLGDHIAMDGPWVLDTNHGWREIHPVDRIEILAHA